GRMGLSTFYRQAVPGCVATFGTTHWSVVLAAGGGDREKAREALEQLCAGYWYPLYVFARRQGYDAEESEDLTQEFLARLLQRNDLAEVSPERGRFRSFLLASFRHFLANEYHRQQTEKRGGRAIVVSLDHEEPESRYRLDPADPVTPETLFKRRWALTVLERAVERVRKEYAASERADLFEELKEFLCNQRALAHAAIASKYGISVGSVGVTIHRLRKRYAEVLREEIAHTVSALEEIDDEIRHLIVAVSV
ncbi:MAG: sigma-70 family RNA polymerase sigma factor, partial [Verrucomicrobiales bacterium]|nr:sigma-70 family RNA polymerase sigma factor [Verrucomicrobiales bacterium]